MLATTLTRFIATAATAAAISVPLATSAGAAGAQFGIDPGSGPAGTSVFAKSADPCKPEPGASAWTVLVKVERDGARLATRNFVVSPDGHWAGTIRVPDGTEPSVVLITAECFDSRHAVKADVVYEPRKFLVTEPEVTTASTTPDPKVTATPKPTPPTPTPPPTKPNVTPKATPRTGTPTVTG